MTSAPLVAALLVLVSHASVLVGHRAFFYEDHLRFSVPLLETAAGELCHGRVPSWNPHEWLGKPLLTEPVAMAAYPPVYLACVLPAARALELVLIVQLAFFAAGVAALLIDLGVAFVLAAACGLALAWAGPAPSLVSVAPYLATLSFFPWVLLAARRLARAERPGAPGVALGLAVGLATLAGDVPGALVQALVAGALLLAETGRAAWRRLAIAGPVALVVGAAAWVPLVWYVGQSVRADGLGGVEAGHWSFAPREWLELFVPHLDGLPLPENTFWRFFTEGEPRRFVHAWYVGGALAAVGLGHAIVVRRQPFARVAAVAALLLGLLATGSATPLWRVVRPVFAFIRYPSKLGPYAVVLVALLGALALAGPSSSGRRLRVSLFGAFVLAAVGLFIVGPWQATLAAAAHAPPAFVDAYLSDLRLGCALAMACAGVVVVATFREGRWRQPLMAAAIAFDALVAGLPLRWTAPPDALAPSRPAWLASAGAFRPRVVRAADLDEARLHKDVEGYLRELARARGLLRPSFGVSAGAEIVEGYGGLAPADGMRRLAALYTADPILLAEVVGARHVLVPPRARRWAERLAGEGRVSRPVSLPEGALMVAPLRARPRAYVSTAWTFVAPGTETAALRARAFDGPAVLAREEALVGGRPAHVPEAPVGAFAGPLVPATPLAIAAGELRYRVICAAACALVHMDAFARGWRASVDGQEVPIRRADAVGRAVLLPAGDHDVRLWFSGPAAGGPLIASWLGLALAALAIGGLRRTRVFG